MNLENIKVLGDRVLVKEYKSEDKTKAGIIISNTSAQQRTYTGEVLLTGKGACLENGTIKPMEVYKGNKVVFAKFAGTPIEIENEEYIVLNERDIILVL